MAPTNVYFDNYNYQPEQTLYEDLIIEAIKIYGVDVKYIPRVLNNYDELYTEDAISSYECAIDIEMYVKSVDGFTGEGVFLSKYGLDTQGIVRQVLSLFPSLEPSSVLKVKGKT